MKPKTVFEYFNGHPERWHKGCLFKDSSADLITAIEVEEGVEPASCCILGAIRFVYGFDMHKYVLCRDIATPLMPVEFANVPAFNDDDKTTFEQVLDVVKRAGI